MITGKKVELRPMTLGEVPDFYNWAIKCPYWYGEFSDEPVPTYEKFREDWQHYYFDGSQPEKGQVFTIIAKDKPVGEINYEIDQKQHSAEIDILIFCENQRGKGFDPDALGALVDLLFAKMDVETCIIEHHVENIRAIRASKKLVLQKPKGAFTTIQSLCIWSLKKIQTKTLIGGVNGLTEVCCSQLRQALEINNY